MRIRHCDDITESRKHAYEIRLCKQVVVRACAGMPFADPARAPRGKRAERGAARGSAVEPVVSPIGPAWGRRLPRGRKPKGRRPAGKAPRAIEGSNLDPRGRACRSARGAWRRPAPRTAAPGRARPLLQAPRHRHSCLSLSSSGPCRAGAARARGRPAPACGPSGRHLAALGWRGDDQIDCRTHRGARGNPRAAAAGPLVCVLQGCAGARASRHARSTRGGGVGTTRAARSTPGGRSGAASAPRLQPRPRLC